MDSVSGVELANQKALDDPSHKIRREQDEFDVIEKQQSDLINMEVTIFLIL